MDVPSEALLWIVGLGVALYASERLVHYLVEIGRETQISPGLLGLMVACGADAPELTSALVAVVRGSSDVGLGVIVGSNIYNLAGLLGLAAIVGGSLATDFYLLALDGGTNALLMLGLVGLILLPAAHLPLGALMILLLAGYAAITAIPRRRVLEALGIPPHSIEEEVQELPASSGPTHPIPLLSLFLALSIAFIVLGSDVLVNESLILGPKLGVPSSVIGTFVLAIATSLPNTWAAISLARRGLGASAIASTFNSNSINAALGAGFPSLVLTLHAAHPAGTFDASWLLAMTAAAIALLAAGRSLRRAEALILVAMYIAFVTARLAIFGA